MTSKDATLIRTYQIREDQFGQLLRHAAHRGVSVAELFRTSMAGRKVDFSFFKEEPEGTLLPKTFNLSDSAESDIRFCANLWDTTPNRVVRATLDQAFARYEQEARAAKKKKRR
ncbi:MAG: hypothetical protein RLZZ324_879 [Candidatus Parcubacteria bacterium]